MEANIIKTDAGNFGGLCASSFDVGTVFALPNGQLWRVAAGRGYTRTRSFVRMTRKDGTLKAGEARWMPNVGGR